MGFAKLLAGTGILDLHHELLYSTVLGVVCLPPRSANAAHTASGGALSSQQLSFGNMDPTGMTLTIDRLRQWERPNHHSQPTWPTVSMEFIDKSEAFYRIQ